jgi:putative peptidoglycan lipid II flippase
VVNKLWQNGKNLLLRRQTSILSAAFVIMVAYAASGVLGLVRNRLLAGSFFSGSEAHLDAYFAAFVLPDTIFQLLILGALSASFIPIFTTYLRRDRDEAWHVASAAITGILFSFLLIAAALFIFAVPATRLLVPDFPENLILLTASLTRIMLAAQFFFALSAFMTGILQSHHRFLLSALAPLFYNLGIIAGIILLSPVLGIYGPAAGVILGAFLHFAVQLPLALKLGFRVNFSIDFGHSGVRRIFRLMPARTAALSLGQQLDKVIATVVSSSLTAGTLAIFNFARQLYVLPVTLFGATVGQASFPALSHARHDDGGRFRATIAMTLLQLLFFSFPAAALLLVLRIPAVRLAFGARQFPWEATLLTGKAVALFALAVPAQTANQVLTRCFYAAQNTKTPLLTALISAFVFIALVKGFSTWTNLGILGVISAIVASDIINFFLLLVLLELRLVPGLIKTLRRPLSKIIFATAVTGICLWIPLRLLDQFVFDTTRTLPLIGLTATVSAIGMGIYFLLAKILRLRELESVSRLFRRLSRWREILAESAKTLTPQTAGLE